MTSLFYHLPLHFAAKPRILQTHWFEDELEFPVGQFNVQKGWKYYAVWGVWLFQMFCKIILRVPSADYCLLWKHGRCSIGPMTCVTLMKHSAKLPVEQPAAPDCSDLRHGCRMGEHLDLCPQVLLSFEVSEGRWKSEAGFCHKIPRLLTYSSIPSRRRAQRLASWVVAA